MSRYTRKAAAEKLTSMGYPVSPNTIYRWEKEGKTPSPNRLKRTRQCLYNDEIIAAIKNFMSQEEPPPAHSAT
jgi:hypothetical protein